jgi:O-succinylbenzoate synthase
MGTSRLDFRRIRRRFRTPLRTGIGLVESVDRLLIRGEDASGAIGYGEVAPWPGFKTESVDDAERIVRAAQGNLEQLHRVVQKDEANLPCLASALSMLTRWSEIKKFAGGVNCAALLREDASPDEAVARVAQGFSVLKLKIGPATTEGSIRAILAATPQATTLRLDANGLLTLVPARAWTEFARSEPRIEYIEQPLPIDHAGYTSLGPEKIALDESFTSPRDDTRWPGIIVVKPSLVGNWESFRRWSKNSPAKFIFSSCFETAIGRQAALALAAELQPEQTTGFDTLGWFEPDGRERHAPGPVARGLADYDWERFWEEVA